MGKILLPANQFCHSAYQIHGLVFLCFFFCKTQLLGGQKTSYSHLLSLFYLPSSCRDVDFSICSSFEPTSSVILEDLEEDSNMSLMDPSKQPNTPSKRRRTAKGKAVISEDDLRRSLRLKKVNKGFKTSACKDKNCLGCSVSPPTISPTIIRNLGASFCNINPEDLSDENL